MLPATMGLVPPFVNVGTSANKKKIADDFLNTLYFLVFCGLESELADISEENKTVL